MDSNLPGRRVSRRRAVQLEVVITLKGPPSRAIGGEGQGLTLVGRTRNLSETGMALAVSAGNIDRYLKRTEHPFEIKLRLPNRVVQLKAKPVHYKRSTSPQGAVTYLIGASFNDSAPEELEAIAQFLRSLP
jgi:hypothetical protein